MTLEELHNETTAVGWELRAQQLHGQVYAWLRETGTNGRTAREFVGRGPTLAAACAEVVRNKNEATK